MKERKRKMPSAVELAGRLNAASGELESAASDVKLLGEELHAALDHVDAMLKCMVFDPVRDDITAVRSALAHLNSDRVWAEGHIRKARAELAWEDGDGEEV